MWPQLGLKSLLKGNTAHARSNWLPGALRDVDRLYRFLAQKSPAAAQRAAAAILKSANALADFPELGTPIADKAGFREIYVSFGQSAYVIRYTADNPNGNVLITRVWHGKEQERNS